MVNILKIFLSFLREKECLGEYFCNTSINCFFSCLSNPNHLLTGAFTFHRTPQGDSYWWSRNTEWKTLYEACSYEVPSVNVWDTYKKLFEYLQTKNSLENFINNCFTSKTSAYKVLEDIPHYIQDMISLAFDWTATPEGYDYWVKVSRGWSDYIIKERGNTPIKPIKKVADSDTDKKPLTDQKTKMKVYKYSTKIEYIAQVVADKPLAPNEIHNIKEWLVENYPDIQEFEQRTDNQAIIGFKKVEVYTPIEN